MLTAEQLALRRTGIGGSEIAVIAGLDARRTPFDVYLSKVEGFELADTPDLERGRFLEPGIANWYAHRKGCSIYEPGTLVHPTRPRVLCTPDRIAQSADGSWLVSIKAPGPFAEGFGDEGTDEVPMAYLVQLQWELAVCRPQMELAEWAHLAAPVSHDLAVFTVHSDEELQGELMEVAEKFWRDHVEPRRPPPIEGSAHVGDWLKRRFPRHEKPMREATAEEEVLALELMEAEAERVRAERREAAAIARLKQAIGEGEGLEGAFGRVTWRTNKRGVRPFCVKWRKT